jgi:hypothetical protein
MAGIEEALGRLAIDQCADGLDEVYMEGAYENVACCDPSRAWPPHMVEIVSAEESGDIQTTCTNLAAALTEMAATFPTRNDEDPNSSWLDIDGWMDDFALTDWNFIGTQANILFTSMASVDWASVTASAGTCDPDEQDCSVDTSTLTTDATLATKFASIPHVRAAKSPPSQTCPNRLPGIGGSIAEQTSPKRVKDILDASAVLVNKLMRIDWTGSMPVAECTSPDVGCGAFLNEDSCNGALILPPRTSLLP